MQSNLMGDNFHFNGYLIQQSISHIKVTMHISVDVTLYKNYLGGIFSGPYLPHGCLCPVYFLLAAKKMKRFNQTYLLTDT